MKLWQTSTTLNPIIEEYTVGDDYILDKILIPYDLQGSLAHLKMLAKKNVVTQEELLSGINWLQEIGELHSQWKFHISKEQEDMHTAIEVFLTEKYWSVWKKIHTWRSRNDQILVALRLYMKDQKRDIEVLIHALISLFEKKISETDKHLQMPGYTHYQKAMRTTVVKWYESYKNAFEDQLVYFSKIDAFIDQSPLWSASGFGIANFDNDRDFTANELWFAKVQRNELYCGLSRGLFELCFLQSLEPLFLLMTRCANDLLLFSTQEFSFITIPPSFTTWSSIMPQKRNWDFCEVMRANQSVFSSYVNQIKSIYSKLISGYQRDLQLTKWPLIRGIELFSKTIQVLGIAIWELEWNKEILENSLDESLLLTEKVYELVNKGVEFREAYKIVKDEYFLANPGN